MTTKVLLIFLAPELEGRLIVLFVLGMSNNAINSSEHNDYCATLTQVLRP
jgi:hypothetical protein